MSGKKLFVHIGIGKTGTTSVQHALEKYQDRLLDSKILYPKTGRAYSAHHNLASLNDLSFSNAWKDRYDGLVREIDKSSADTIIISSEFFSFVKPGFVKDIKKYLSDFDTKVIFFAREQIGLIESSYKQELRVNHKFSYPIAVYIQQVKRAFDFSERVGPWAEHFGQDAISVNLYSTKPSDRTDTVSIVFSALGLDGKEYSSSFNENKSIPAEFCNAVRLLNKSDINEEDRLSVIDELASVRFNGKNSSICNQNEIKTIVQNYKEKNIDFMEKYMDGNICDELLFDGVKI